MMIQLEPGPGGLAVNPRHVSSVEVENFGGERVYLEIVMKSGGQHSIKQHPDKGVDVYELHRQIVEASQIKP